MTLWLPLLPGLLIECLFSTRAIEMGFDKQTGLQTSSIMASRSYQTIGARFSVPHNFIGIVDCTHHDLTPEQRAVDESIELR